MNKYKETVLNMLFDMYPGYSFEFEDYPSIIMVSIISKSSGFVIKRRVPKYKDASLIIHRIEMIIYEMREKELKSVASQFADWHNKNLIDKKYSITPRELIFQDEKTTVVNWTDDTKTVVKCSDDDTFSPEAGIALCYMKKFIVDNNSERFHRLLKSLISVSKFKDSKQIDKNPGLNYSGLGAVIKKVINKVYTMEENHDLDTGTPTNSGDNDSDNASMEVVS